MVVVEGGGLHTPISQYREEAADIIKAATKQKGSGALAAWEEEQNDVIMTMCHPRLNPRNILLYVSLCYMSLQALQRGTEKRAGQASGRSFWFTQ